MSRNLSKSKYLAGLQCDKRLWLALNDPEKAVEISQSKQRLFDQGKEVGQFARRLYPGGFLIDFDRSQFLDALEKTSQAIDRGERIIFEAAFLYDDIIVLTDILARNWDGTWDIIEVKSAGEVKPEYIPDLAVQKYVLEGVGLYVRGTSVMHINKECVYPDLSKLFLIVDVTEEVENILRDIPVNIDRFKRLILNEAEPAVVIGPHCNRPYECEFIDYCWKDVGKMSVFHIPGLSLTKKDELRGLGILRIEQVPPDYPLSFHQRAYIERMLTGKITANKKQIRRMISKLEYPIHFLDFETDSPAVPRLDGMRPFQLVAFQLSCHILHADGTVQHHEYLHGDASDPRERVIEALLSIVNDRGSVVSYNANFERRVMSELAIAFPKHSKKLESVNSRLWDQLDIFRNHYKHPGFGNSNSLKSVLPVLVPRLTYQDLAVRDGTEAQVVWNAMIRERDADQKDRMIEDLKAYCRMDTLAMVEIHKLLRSIV